MRCEKHNFHKLHFQAVQKGLDARRARKRRAEAYSLQYVGARRLKRNGADEPFQRPEQEVQDAGCY